MPCLHRLEVEGFRTSRRRDVNQRVVDFEEHGFYGLIWRFMPSAAAAMEAAFSTSD